MTAQKNYRVDSFVGGLAIKAPVRVASTANLVLSGEQVVNSVSLVVGDRILVKDQTATTENGIYEVETSAWKRAADFDGNRDVVGGTIIPAYRAGDGEIEQWNVDGTPIAKTPGQAMTMTLYFDPAAAGIPDAPVDATSYVRNNGAWVSEAASSLPSPAVDSVLAGNAGATNWAVAANITINQLSGALTTESSINSSDGTDEYTIVTAAGITSMFGSVGILYVEQAEVWRNLKPFLIAEQASAEADVAAFGQFWVKSDVPNVPMFTDDTGVDQLIDPSMSEPNIQNGNYTTLIGDKGKTIYKVSGGAGETITIAAEASVDYPVGTMIGFDNDGGGALTIDVGGADTLINANDGTTGSVSLATGGEAVARKNAAGQWKIAGSQMT